MEDFHVKKKSGNDVFLISIVITLAISLWGILLPKSFEKAAQSSLNLITQDFGWLYVLSMTLFVGFCIWIGFFSKYRDIRLGKDDDRPEYSDIAWFSMLFSAGMGVGLVFWGTAEPMNYFVNPIGGIAAGSGEAMKFAFVKSFLHWGIHPWANYSVLALALAYMQFRKGKPALVSSVFIPLLGEDKVKGPIGKTIDILAIFATAGGVATSLGLGVLQINSGMKFLARIPENISVQIGLIVVLTIIYTWTAVAGIDKGISKVCDLNIKIAIGCMIVCAIVGPTVPILNNLVDGLGQYVSGLLSNTLAIGAFGDSAWYKGWTVFYWAWWIAWAPFTGSFVARISKGRTIGEFVKGVMLLPAGFSVIWFAIYGTMGLNLGLDRCRYAISSTSTALFVVLKEYPLGTIISIVMFVLICTFFITSANSATYVLGMYSEGGTLQPSDRTKTMWGIIMAALAAAMMIASSDGLSMLQILSIVAAFPFVFIMLLAMVSIVKALKSEKQK